MDSNLLYQQFLFLYKAVFGTVDSNLLYQQFLFLYKAVFGTVDSNLLYQQFVFVGTVEALASMINASPQTYIYRSCAAFRTHH